MGRPLAEESLRGFPGNANLPIGLLARRKTPIRRLAFPGGNIDSQAKRAGRVLNDEFRIPDFSFLKFQISNLRFEIQFLNF
jgi:hypothetical protein